MDLIQEAGRLYELWREGEPPWEEVLKKSAVSGPPLIEAERWFRVAEYVLAEDRQKMYDFYRSQRGYVRFLTGMIGWFGKYPWPVVPAEEPHHTVMKKLDCGHTQVLLLVPSPA